jgi:phosphatidylinositol-3-phosphatase
MRRLAILLAAVVVLAGSLASWGSRPTTLADKPTATTSWPADLPVYDHVVIVIEENKDYDQIIDNPKAPYINFTLREEGANFTRMFGEEHNSQGNHFWLFSGSNQNVGFRDVIPTKKNHLNYPFTAPNLGKSLIDKGLSFKGYSEDLPAIGSTVEKVEKGGATIYGRKHVPWISFANVPNGDTVETSSNLRFNDFPTEAAKFSTLPTVAIPRGDQWLRKNLDAYRRWARKNNSLLILTFDESDNRTGYLGLTNPFVEPKNQYRKVLQNRIPTIFVGAHVKAGDYPEGKGITHVNILRTLEAMYGVPRAGAQQPNAAGGGINDDYVMTDVFEKVK